MKYDPKKTITFDPMKDDWNEFEEKLRQWNTKKLERITDDMREVSESLPTTLKSLKEMFDSFHDIENTLNEHVTDNTMEFFTEPPNEEPPKEFRMLMPWEIKTPR